MLIKTFGLKLLLFKQYQIIFKNADYLMMVGDVVDTIFNHFLKMIEKIYNT